MDCFREAADLVKRAGFVWDDDECIFKQSQNTVLYAVRTSDGQAEDAVGVNAYLNRGAAVDCLLSMNEDLPHAENWIQELYAVSQPSKTLECEWRDDGGDLWNSACGASWFFESGGPEDNEQNYCGKCGGKVAVFSGKFALQGR